MAPRAFTRMSKNFVNLGNLYVEKSRRGGGWNSGGWAYFEDGSVYVFHALWPNNDNLETQMKALSLFVRNPSPRLQQTRQREPDRQRLMVTRVRRPSNMSMNILACNFGNGQKLFSRSYRYDRINLTFDQDVTRPLTAHVFPEPDRLGGPLRRWTADALHESNFRGTLIDGILQPNVRLPNRLTWTVSASDGGNAVQNGSQSLDAPKEHDQDISISYKPHKQEKEHLDKQWHALQRRMKRHNQLLMGMQPESLTRFVKTDVPKRRQKQKEEKAANPVPSSTREPTSESGADNVTLHLSKNTQELKSVLNGAQEQEEEQAVLPPANGKLSRALERISLMSQSPKEDANADAPLLPESPERLQDTDKIRLPRRGRSPSVKTYPAT